MNPEPKVIGEGAYGCIHRPSLTCKNKKMNYKNKVSKILLKRHALKEMHQYLRIARADKKSDFYLGKPTECIVDDTKENINAIRQCKEGYNITEAIDDYSLLVMRDGGIDIEVYLTNLVKMKNTKMINRKLKLFWLEFKRMFEGCELFLKHDIINHDVKPQNILYDESKKRMNFVDFGLMQSYKKVVAKLRKSNYWYVKNAHWSYPFEIQFLNKNKYDDFARKSEEEKMTFYSKIIYNLNNGIETHNTDMLKTLFSYVLPKYNSREFTTTYLTDIFYFLKTDFTERSYNEFVQECLTRFDLYGIGFTILFALNMVQDFMDPYFYKDLFEFSYKLITPRLYERYTCKEANIKYNELLNKHSINTIHLKRTLRLHRPGKKMRQTFNKK
jgi:sRNA-binding regulator protein Hfq